MKMTVESVLRNFHVRVPGCECNKTVSKTAPIYIVRLHLNKPDTREIQAVDVTCECCGKTAYANVAQLGVTREMLVL